MTGPCGAEAGAGLFGAGGAVLVWDPAIEGEADVVFPGARLKPESCTFLLTQVCGYPCVPCAPAVLERLDIEVLPGARPGSASPQAADAADRGPQTPVSAARRRPGRMLK